jgi:hypothetical protein
MDLILSKLFLKFLLKKFGAIKKIDSSLHCKTKNMQRILLHIESANKFSPVGDYTVCGACMLQG